MKYREFEVNDIPCLEFLMESDSILYVGPRLSWWQRRKLRKVQDEFQIIYLYDLLDGITKEQLWYNFPGVKFPHGFSAETIYQSIRESIEAEAEVKVSPETKSFIRYDGSRFIVLEGTKKLSYAISYLKENYHSFIVLESSYARCSCDAYEFDPREVCELDDEFEYQFPIEEELIREPSCKSECQHEPVKEEEDCDVRFRVSTPMEEPPILSSRKERIPTSTVLDSRINLSIDSVIESVNEPSPEEVKKSIDALILSGFPIEIIKSWLEERVKLSRLRITRNFKILLVDYDIEVKMGPLPKTIFLFYLRHPEGVKFSYLQDHIKELLHIYGHLSKNDDPIKMKESIDSLTNPFNNSISEKCTAVKNAFTKVVNEDIAKHYYIRGVQGGKKGISLNRSMVEWERKL